MFCDESCTLFYMGSTNNTKEQAMSKYTNPKHLDNFKSDKANRVAIFDVTQELSGTRYFELASGKSVEEAKERLFMRFMVRGADCAVECELIMKAQGRLLIAQMDGAQFANIIERQATLIV